MGDQWRREASGCTSILGRVRRGRTDRAARAFVEGEGRGLADGEGKYQGCGADSLVSDHRRSPVSEAPPPAVSW